MKKQTAEQKLLNELAENGTDKQRELFLQFQQERNKQTEAILEIIEALAAGSVHLIGVQAVKEIGEKCIKIRNNELP